ncbi:MAG: hypothetical protein JJ896_00550 [Rhodothermales bacterium]|nr:hypothetical protein [Rhodothermales bacterium]MBO6778116.1 hypothetical protein [Rhodothermales bacterium]
MKRITLLLFTACALSACDSLELDFEPERRPQSHELRMTGRITAAGSPVVGATVAVHVTHVANESFQVLSRASGFFEFSHRVTYPATCGILGCDVGCSANVRASSTSHGWAEKRYPCSVLGAGVGAVTFQLSPTGGTVVEDGS